MARIVNISDHLAEQARQNPFRPAVVFPEAKDYQGRVAYTHYTYRELEAECQILAHGLLSIGIGKGCRTVLMVRPSLDFFALTFALFRIGAVPVLIDPGLGVRGIGKCLNKVEPAAFIGIPKAHLARKIFGWCRRTLKTTVNVGPGAPFADYSIRQLRSLGQAHPHFDLATVTADDMAAILFTSGSTGAPKGATYTHRNFLSQVELLRDVYGLAPGEVDLCTFPLFALFSAALGLTAVIPKMDFTRPAMVNPDDIFNAIEQFGVTNMFGSPALLRRIAPAATRQGLKFSTIRRVISAGAPVSVDTIRAVAAMLPATAEIHTPYGATEALPVCSVGSREILAEAKSGDREGRGILVGRPVDGLELRVIKISDQPIEVWDSQLQVPAGTIGEVVVCGPQVTAGYFNFPQADRLGKIFDVETGRVIHRMGDLGYLDHQGRLWFCGRKGHRVTTDAETLYTIPCESIFNRHHQVARTALVGVGKLGAEKPVLCVELKSPLSAKDQAKLRDELLELGSHTTLTRNIKTVAFYKKRFPVDVRHNSKIFREKLKVWAERELS